jgi:hypothetical protein
MSTVVTEEDYSDMPPLEDYVPPTAEEAAAAKKKTEEWMKSLGGYCPLGGPPPDDDDDMPPLVNAAGEPLTFDEQVPLKKSPAGCLSIRYVETVPLGLVSPPTASPLPPPWIDVSLVMEQTQCTKEKAMEALEKCNGDIVDAIIRIVVASKA